MPQSWSLKFEQFKEHLSVLSVFPWYASGVMTWYWLAYFVIHNTCYGNISSVFFENNAVHAFLYKNTLYKNIQDENWSDIFTISWNNNYTAKPDSLKGRADREKQFKAIGAHAKSKAGWKVKNIHLELKKHHSYIKKSM